MADPKVLISILNWNAPESTVKTVESVLLSAYSNYKILLLDNNSTDNSVSILKSTFPNIDLIKTKTNLGYAGGHKIAAKIAVKENYDLLWILNNDVEVYGDSLGELVTAYLKNGPSLLGSITIDENEIVSTSGGTSIKHEFSDDPQKQENLFNGKNINQVVIEEQEVTYINGSSLLIPVMFIRKYGFMYTHYFLYGEETEYCFRLRRKYGVASIIVPESKVIHLSGGSFKQNEKLNWIRVYYKHRNNNLVFNKYFKESGLNEGWTFAIMRKYLSFFFRHFFSTSQNKQAVDYWLNYYKELGNFHSLIGLKGRYLSPEKFLNT